MSYKHFTRTIRHAYIYNKRRKTLHCDYTGNSINSNEYSVNMSLSNTKSVKIKHYNDNASMSSLNH